MSPMAVPGHPPGGQVLVVAHPDDEALWFSSVLRDVDRTIVCYRDMASDPACTAGRRSALEELPLRSVACLGLADAETFEAADWSAPRETRYGLEVRRHARSMPGLSPETYRANFERLLRELREPLAGAQVVYTHGPWGEYGHEDHVQVFRAVDELRREMGFELRFPLYASEKSAALLARYLPRLPAAWDVRPTDAALAARLRAIYERHRCWTWYPGYEWPSEEAFARWTGEAGGPRRGAILPVRMLHVGWRGGSPGGPGIAREALRRLRALGRS